VRTLQTVVLALLLVVLVAVTALGVVFGWTDSMAWMPTPLAFVAITAPLFAAAGASVACEPRHRLVLAACCVSVLAFHAVLELAAPEAIALGALLVLCLGDAALVIASVVGSHRTGRNLPVSVAVVGGVATLLVFAGSAFMVLGDLYNVGETRLGPVSPDGEWTLVASESNMGATDSGSAEVVVRRDVAGLLRQQRTIWSGYALKGRPRWAAPLTVVLERHRINVFEDSAIDETD
jgi:hypothetical protein